MKLYRIYTLSCAHQLPSVPEGHKCARVHGHNFTVRIECQGDVGPLGWVVDFADLDALWLRCVHDKLDHRSLNDTIPNPTSENLAGWIYTRLAKPYARSGVRLSAIEVEETNKGGVRLEIEGPKS